MQLISAPLKRNHLPYSKKELRKYVLINITCNSKEFNIQEIFNENMPISDGCIKKYFLGVTLNISLN